MNPPLNSPRSTRRTMRRALPLVATGTLALAWSGCGDENSKQSSTAQDQTNTADGANYVSVKRYLLEHTQQLHSQTMHLRQGAEGYYALAKANDFNYQQLLNSKRKQVHKFVK